jgi:hypothetical protein
MPLMKKGSSITTAEAPATTSAAATPAVATPPAKKLGGTYKAGDKASAPMTKDGYWERKEVRDIETGIRIRRSGVWQAALQSTGLLQLNVENTLEAFLALVERTANAGLEYVNRE